MLSFYNIEDDFSNYKDKDVIVFGASIGGIRIQKKLKEKGIEVKYFTDNNDELWGNTINGIEVISVSNMVDYCKQNSDKAIIQIGSMYDMEIEKQLLLYGLKNEIISNEEFRIIIERRKIHKYLKINRDVFKEMILLKYKEDLIKRKENLIESLVRQNENKNELIYMNLSPHKTGNTSLEATLRHYNKNIFNPCHSLKYLNNESLEMVNSEIKKIIIGVREPISQNISMLFECTKIFTDIPIWEEDDRDAQKIFYKYFVNELLNSEQKEYPLSLGKEIWNVYGQTTQLINWLDDHIKEYLGIDVFNYEFDKEKGYSIINQDGREILIYKIEKLNNLNEVFGEFIGVKNLKLIKENVGSQKWYNNRYNMFKEQIKLSKEYINENYNSKYMKHFYSQEEMEKFRKAWNTIES